jgi:hypothetical protein
MHQSSLRLLLTPAAFLFAAALLAACATPASLPVGTDRAAVLARVGAPPERYPLPTGGERWLYPAGGLQQEAWTVDLDATGRVALVRQVRTMENFMRVRIGIDREADVRREFGPPRLMQEYSLVNLVAWMYPYLEDGIWNSEMAIYFDPQGIVRRLENGPDPRFLGHGNERD